MKLKRIEHIDLIVSDLDRSVEFYKRFGFKVLGTLSKPKSVFLGYGDKTSPVMELHQAEPGQRAGLGHLAFYVDDVEQAHQEATQAGVAFHVQPRYGSQSGRTIANCYDPDGIEVQLAHKTTRGEYEDFK
jgi:catechol 2,3-dioxygenase-like lactoylglutathione lyase family enzyme